MIVDVPRPPLRVAVAQFELRPEPTVDAFLAHVEDVVAEAAAHGAALVVLPEFASMGLLAMIVDHDVVGASVAADHRDVLAPLFPQIRDRLSEVAQRLGIAILGGSHNRIADDGSLRNTAILAHSDGRTELQDKLHLTPPEHAMGARGGDDLLVSRIGEFTVGVLICADVQFPELSRHLVERGVDLVLCPSLTWNRRGAHRVRTGTSARAIENQFFVAMSPLVGSSGLPQDAPLHAVGTAAVTCPVDRTFGVNDGILAAAEDSGETMVYADLDLRLLLASRDRPEPPGLKLRRPELYERLAEGLRP